MVKASALYIVIIVALVIAVLCSALIVTAYFYRMQYQKKNRYEHLVNNLYSGINIILCSKSEEFEKQRFISLFEGDVDTVAVQTKPWGIYDVSVVKAYIQKDTLYKAFTTGSLIDSTNQIALYLSDNQNPLSLSGETIIRGDSYVSKAGVQTAYLDNRGYSGDKRLIIGKQLVSEKSLPVLDKKKLNQIKRFFFN